MLGARPSHHGARLPQRARHSPRAPCAREEDEFVVDLAGVSGGTRGRRRLATAREQVGLRQVRQALVHAWLPPQLQVHTHSARSPA